MVDDINVELIQKSINGDIESFESLIKSYYTMLHRYIACKVPNAYDQENVIQETLLLAWMNIKSLKNPNAFKSWLISIATNCCNKWYKANNKTSIPLEQEALFHIIDKRHSYTDKHQYDLQYKIDKLPKSQREAILDFYFRDLKLKEISFMRKVPIGTVKRRLHDGRKNLKIRLENEYE